MGPLRWFLFVYVLGGVTFVPLCIAAVLAFIYYTSVPLANRSATRADDLGEIARPNDDQLVFKSGTDDLEEKFHRKHDSDVAAGYYAVCREYVPGGVNGKPPDRLSPAGEVVANESPSVYQSMYRSIFDRSQKATIDPSKEGAGKTVKRPNNVFYVVLRHGHLMLYDDIQQLDVRYVISLDYHDVDLYGGDEEELPEGDLWVKRNAIRLRRKETYLNDKRASLPFFLFSENMSEKEDFYHALLKNQQRNSDEIPEAEDFDVKHIVGLVQKLHSTEEQLQTRWLNAMIGRLFLAIYKTPELEDFIKSKLMKKISRVKKPLFVTKLSLLKIDTGTAGPFITNPRLKDLTVNGDCVVEADVEYTGNFRLEIGATARIDLGKRFGAREVEMILAVTVKRVQGHALARFKPPPGNRIWFTFEKMPQLDLAVEPIVSARQITYNIILRQIESRIREVVAESMVLPFWDDVPFLSTKGQNYRGGIWKTERARSAPVEIKNEVPEDEAEAGGSGTKTPDAIDIMKKEDRNFTSPSMPNLNESKSSSLSQKTVSSMNEYLVSDGRRTSSAKQPRVLRAPSLAAAIDPKLTSNHADTDAGKEDGASTPKRDSAAMFLKDLSARRSGSTPPGSSDGSGQRHGSLTNAVKDSASSVNTKASNESLRALQQSTYDVSDTPVTTQSSRPTTPTTSTSNSRPSSLHEDTVHQTLAQPAKPTTIAEQRKQAVASATAAAQKWSSIGWGVLSKKQKQTQAPASVTESNATRVERTPAAPIGRGQPLPPPGVPLPKPQKATMLSSIGNMVQKRKPVLPMRSEENGSVDSTEPDSKQRLASRAPPPLPNRRRRQSSRADLGQTDNDDEDLLVVEAPTESAPPSPAAERRARGGEELRDEFFGDKEEANYDRSVKSVENGDLQGEHSNEQSTHDGEHEELQSAITAKPAAPDLPARIVQEAGHPPEYSHSSGRSQPPDLPPRTPTSPTDSNQAPALLSRHSSFRRKPPSRTATINAEHAIETGNNATATSSAVNDREAPGEHRPVSPQSSEALNEERRIGMMEGASWGGGYNE